MPGLPTYRTEVIEGPDGTSEVRTVVLQSDPTTYTLIYRSLGSALKHSFIRPYDVSTHFLEAAIRQDTSGQDLEWNYTGYGKEIGNCQGAETTLSSDVRTVHIALCTVDQTVYELRTETKKPADTDRERYERFISSFSALEGVPENDTTDYLLQASRRIAARAGLEKLQTLILDPDDLEVRLWAGFGLFGEWGYVLRRENGLWIPLFIQEEEQPRNLGAFRISIERPAARYAKSDVNWSDVWDQLIEAEILEINSGVNRLGFDGFHVVLEVHLGDTYRTFVFNFPNGRETLDDRRIMNIHNIIAEAFGLNIFQNR